jgi:hypothetical protein
VTGLWDCAWVAALGPPDVPGLACVRDGNDEGEATDGRGGFESLCLLYREGCLEISLPLFVSDWGLLVEELCGRGCREVMVGGAAAPFLVVGLL